jgi:hypothetical protein
MTTPITDAPRSAKILAATLAFASALALTFATFTRSWFTTDQDDVHTSFGLRSIQTCVTGEGGGETCVPQTLSEMVSDAQHAGAGDEVSAAFPVLGWIASVAMWIAIAGLVASAALMLAGKFVARPIAPTTIALLGLAVGLIGGGAFIATKPGQQYGASLGFFAFCAGELVGIVATLLLARIRPADPEWDNPEPFDEDKW